MKLSGIYRIDSKVHPDRCYIGSAVNIQQRWWDHRKVLRKNKHHSSKLQNHYNKYGEDDLVFVIIEPCFPEFLIIREQFYIDELEPFFNMTLTAGSCLGVKRSQETIDKIKKSKKGHKMSDEFRKKCAERMKGNKLNKGKHWKWTDEQKDKWLRGDKNPSHRKSIKLKIA